MGLWRKKHSDTGGKKQDRKQQARQDEGTHRPPLTVAQLSSFPAPLPPPPMPSVSTHSPAPTPTNSAPAVGTEPTATTTASARAAEPSHDRRPASASPPTFLTGPPTWGVDRLADSLRTETERCVGFYRKDNTGGYVPGPHDWGFAAGAVYKVRNRSPWNTFEYPNREGLIKSFRSSWGVHRRSDLLSSVYRLLAQGHRLGFQQTVSFAAGLDPQAYAEFDASLAEHGVEGEVRWRYRQVRTNAYGVRGTDFTAWDFVRAIMLCSWGTFLDFVTREECLDLMALVQGDMQARYPDWRALGRDFALARWFWAAEGDDRLVDTLAPVNALLDDGAAWQLVPYDMPLPPRDGSFARALVESGVAVPLSEDEREHATTWQRRLDDMIRAGGTGDVDLPSAASLGPISLGESKRAVKFGATVVDLRDGPYRHGPPQGEPGWLVSLAAPFTESYGLYHDGVNPIPIDDEAWRAHLDAKWPQLGDIEHWETALTPPTEIDEAYPADEHSEDARAALTVAWFAFSCRGAVAVGQLDEAEALERIRSAATLIDTRFSSWTEYAAALGSIIGADRGPNGSPYRVVLSDLLDPGLPWGDVGWVALDS